MKIKTIAGISLACATLSLVGCGTNDNKTDSLANDINSIFDGAGTDGTGTNYNYGSGVNDSGTNGYGSGYSANYGFGNYGYGSGYNNDNYNNVYGTNSTDFNSVGYNSSSAGNMDFDITPSNFLSEVTTENSSTGKNK